MTPTIVSIATAAPCLRLEQRQLLAALRENRRLTPLERRLYARFLSDPGIRARDFCAGSIAELLDENSAALRKRFEKQAPILSTTAMRSALAAAGLAGREVGSLTVATCTGFLCPGLSSYVIEGAGLRPDIAATDIVGMGCGGALPALRAASGFLSTTPGSCAAAVCTEICSAAMATGENPELILSNSLFGDGSAACLLSNKPGARGYRLLDIVSRTAPEHRDKLRFRIEEGRLVNVIKKDVARIAAEMVRELVEGLLRRNGVRRETVRLWAIHPGGRKILDSIRDCLGLAETDLMFSRRVLSVHGNVSSPGILYCLKELSAAFPSPRPTVCVTFGAGFSAYAGLLG